MAIYYSIEDTLGGVIKEPLDTKTEVLLYIRVNQVKHFKVFEKDDSTSPAVKNDKGYFFPLTPMKRDITKEITDILDDYGRMEKE